MAQSKRAKGNHKLILVGRETRLCTAASWLALIVSIPILVIACFSVAHLTYQLRSDDQYRIEVVSRYARTFIGQYQRLPRYDEYQTWMVATDEQEGTRLDGRGYLLHNECARETGEFCVSFWTGDVVATYRPGQTNQSEATIDGRAREAWLAGSAFLGLMALAFILKRAAADRKSGTQLE